MAKLGKHQSLKDVSAALVCGQPWGVVENILGEEQQVPVPARRQEGNQLLEEVCPVGVARHLHCLAHIHTMEYCGNKKINV